MLEACHGFKESKMWYQALNFLTIILIYFGRKSIYFDKKIIYFDEKSNYSPQFCNEFQWLFNVKSIRLDRNSLASLVRLVALTPVAAGWMFLSRSLNWGRMKVCASENPMLGYYFGEKNKISVENKIAFCQNFSGFFGEEN